MKEWVLGIICLTLISGVVIIILPKGKTTNLIKICISLICFLFVLKPVVYFDNNGFEIELFDYENAIMSDINYLDFISNSKKNLIIKGIEDILSENNIKNAEINLDAGFFDNKFIVNEVLLNFQNAVIFSEKQHIDIIEDIYREISASFNIDKGIIKIYE